MKVGMTKGYSVVSLAQMRCREVASGQVSAWQTATEAWWQRASTPTEIPSGIIDLHSAHNKESLIENSGSILVPLLNVFLYYRMRWWGHEEGMTSYHADLRCSDPLPDLVIRPLVSHHSLIRVHQILGRTDSQ